MMLRKLKLYVYMNRFPFFDRLYTLPLRLLLSTVT